VPVSRSTSAAPLRAQLWFGAVTLGLVVAWAVAPWWTLSVGLLWPTVVRALRRLQMHVAVTTTLAALLPVVTLIHDTVPWWQAAMLAVAAPLLLVVDGWAERHRHGAGVHNAVHVSILAVVLMVSRWMSPDLLTFALSLTAGNLAAIHAFSDTTEAMGRETSAANWVHSALFGAALPLLIALHPSLPLAAVGVWALAACAPQRRAWQHSFGVVFPFFVVGAAAAAAIIDYDKATDVGPTEGWVLVSLFFWAAHVLLHLMRDRQSALQSSDEARIQLEHALEAACDRAWDWNLRTDWVVTRQHGQGQLRSRFTNWTSEVHPHDVDRVTEKLSAHLRGDVDLYESEHRVPHPSGTWTWVFERGRVVERDVDGQPVRMLGIQRDVTAAHEAEEERARLSTRMEQNQRLESLGLLAGGVAHDFNNLLSAVVANLDLALEDAEETHLTHSLEDARGASMRAADLCKHLLAYAGRRSLESEVLKLQDVVEETHHLLRASISPGIEVTRDLDRRTPALLADGAQVRQVMMNLLLNAADAIDARPSERRDGAILLKTTIAYVDDNADTPGFVVRPPPGDYACLEVRDNGCGMTPSTLERLFDPFFTTKRSGRGLGMAAVLGIVRAHDGGIWVESTYGEGTVFRVFWPLGDAAELTESESSVVAFRLAGGGQTVLVVDDEAPLRRVLRRVLRKRGFDVLTADNGFDALHLLEEHHNELALVITDVMMPGPTGLDLLQHLRKHRDGRLHSDLPVVLMSGFDGAEDDVPLDAAVRFLHKPFSIAQFERLLVEFLDGADDDDAGLNSASRDDDTRGEPDGEWPLPGSYDEDDEHESGAHSLN